MFGWKFLCKAADVRKFFFSSIGSPKLVFLSYPVVESDASLESLGFHFHLPRFMSLTVQVVEIF